MTIFTSSAHLRSPNGEVIGVYLFGVVYASPSDGFEHFEQERPPRRRRT